LHPVNLERTSSPRKLRVATDQPVDKNAQILPGRRLFASGIVFAAAGVSA
jgi:hypothetical protein